MKITILGSGTAAPVLNRNMSGYLLNAGDTQILLDSGPGCLRQLLKLDICLMDIDNLFFTHLHHDHIGELGAYVWAYNYGLKRSRPLYVYGPKGIRPYFDILLTKILNPSKLNFKVNIHEMGNGSEIRIKSSNGLIRVKSAKVKHSGESLGYRIEHDGKAICYSGDGGYCNSIIKLSKNADVLILDCAFPDEMPNPIHLTPKECGMIASKANAKKLILTHMNPECSKKPLIHQCRTHYNGRVMKANDFMRITA